ncbi:MAG: hypothetical protein AB2417_10425 [Clostridiaceae bacterium]
MGILNCKNCTNCRNEELIKSHSKLGILSLISIVVVYIMGFAVVFCPNEYFWLREHRNLLFNVLGWTQNLLTISAVVFSIIDIHRKKSKKLIPTISIILIVIFIFIIIRSLVYLSKL